MKTKNMTINELMRYYLEGAKVAEVIESYHTIAAPGTEQTVFVKTFGGEGYTEQIKAKAWGEIKPSDSTVIMQLPFNKYYVFSDQTLNEVINLLKSDLSDCEVIQAHTSSASQPGATFYAEIKGKPSIRAVAWYEIPYGDLKIFQVKGKYYGISLGATKTISQEIVSERKTGKFATPDKNREIIWRDLGL